MRIHRIVLRSFRGVEAATIDFSATGVTIVEGPNEIGKSSIAEALHLLFDELDSSGKQKVKSVKPVHTDSAPYVEAELTSGPYRLVYAKQWLRQPATTLTVSAPAPESLTGRAAHDRVVRILEETLDVALFRALRYEQGSGIAQAELGGSPSLARALDAAATGAAGSGNGAGGSDDTDGLWQRVEAERLRYFTGTGRLTVERTREAEELDELRRRETALAEELRDLEAAAERFRQIALELAANKAQREQHSVRLAELEAAANQAGALAGEVERLRIDAERAQGLAREAGTAGTERRRLVQAVATARERCAELTRAAAEDAPGITGTLKALEAARREHAEARSARQTAEAAAAAAHADHEYLREAADAELLAERHGRAIAAEQAIREATAAIESCTVDEAMLRRIGETELAVAIARSRAADGGSAVTVEALLPTQARIGEEAVTLTAGEQVQRSVAGDVEVIIGDIARVRVAGATAARELAAALAEAEAARAALYGEADIDPAAPDAEQQARARLETRRGAEQQLAGAKGALLGSLIDLSGVAELAAKLERANARTAATAAERATTAPLPVDASTARIAAEAAAEAVAEAGRLEERRAATLGRAENAHSTANAASLERGVLLEAAGRDQTLADTTLADARATIADDALDAAYAEAEATATTASAGHASAAAALAEADPETGEALLRNEQGRRQRLLDAEQELLLDRERIKAVLETRGQAGLADQLSAVTGEIARRARAKTLTDRRAAAAELLHTRLAEHRDAARRSYVAPLKQQIETFARIVFGPTVSVELDHATLAITSRTLDGVTVPFESLSGGAREQLSVLARLACAALVSHDAVAGSGHGVPVIFDDALGYSDSARLERLGAAFAVAADRCQVIVLTCMPDRYAHIGAATVVRLPRGTGA